MPPGSSRVNLGRARHQLQFSCGPMAGAVCCRRVQHCRGTAQCPSPPLDTHEGSKLHPVVAPVVLSPLQPRCDMCCDGRQGADVGTHVHTQMCTCSTHGASGSSGAAAPAHSAHAAHTYTNSISSSLLPCRHADKHTLSLGAVGRAPSCTCSLCASVSPRLGNAEERGRGVHRGPPKVVALRPSGWVPCVGGI